MDGHELTEQMRAILEAEGVGPIYVRVPECSCEDEGPGDCPLHALPYVVVKAVEPSE